MNETSLPKHVVLVGATDGLGLALAREYAARGWTLCIIGRSAPKLERALAEVSKHVPGGEATGGRVCGVVCDVADPGSIERAFDAARDALGQIGLLIYCAGVMPPARDLTERLEGAASIFDVNVLGAIGFMERGASYLESQGRGRLAAIGSIAGVRGRKGDPVYGASKAALHTYLEGLRHRLHPHGVGVSTIKPGFVRTRMLREDPGFPPAVSPERAARSIADALSRGRDEFYVPWWWGPIAMGLRVLPTALHKRFAPP